MIRPVEIALKLEIIGWIGKNQIDTRRRKPLKHSDAVANDHLIAGSWRKIHSGGWSGKPGTRDLDPGFGASNPDTRDTHKQHRLLTNGSMGT